jgi:hypothetical protein
MRNVIGIMKTISSFSLIERSPIVLNSFGKMLLTQVIKLFKTMRDRRIKYNSNMVKIGLTNELYYLNRKKNQKPKDKSNLMKNLSNRLIDFLGNRKGDCLVGGDKGQIIKVLKHTDNQFSFVVPA